MRDDKSSVKASPSFWLNVAVLVGLFSLIAVVQQYSWRALTRQNVSEEEAHIVLEDLEAEAPLIEEKVEDLGPRGAAAETPPVIGKGKKSEGSRTQVGSLKPEKRYEEDKTFDISKLDNEETRSLYLEQVRSGGAVLVKELSAIPTSRDYFVPLEE